MDRTIVEIGDGVWIYLPERLTPEQETKVIAHYLGSFEPEAHEVTCKELLRQHTAGLVTSHETEAAVSQPANAS